jgi:aspartyl-tRNA(Asn)/glutamyl-tRNA(Gln) amidotransferase subunit B
VSLRPVGTEPFGTRAEIKNMNSLRSLGRAIEYEILRQAALLDAGERVVQETRHWDENDGRTHSMRSKEEAFDYRYFPEPDLVPVAPSPELRARVVAEQPELPAAKRQRFIDEWEISDADARILVSQAGLAPYAEAAVDALGGKGSAKDVCNWCVGDVLGYLNESGLAIEVLPLAPDGLAELVGLVAEGTISRNQAKDVLAEALREPKRPSQIVEDRGLKQVSDTGALGGVIDEVLAANPKEAAEYRDGDDDRRKKLRGFFMGKCMAALKGQGNPQLLNQLLDEKLG